MMASLIERILIFYHLVLFIKILTPTMTRHSPGNGFSDDPQLGRLPIGFGGLQGLQGLQIRREQRAIKVIPASPARQA